MCGDSPTGELTRSFKKLIWSASVILIGDSWYFDISIQDKRDVIDLPSKCSLQGLLLLSIVAAGE